MPKAAMSPEQANAVFDVLTSECGAREALREDFVSYMERPTEMHEFRFGGALGYGGKLYWDGRGAPRVGCYPEDDTLDRAERQTRANDKLLEIAPDNSPEE